MVYSELIGHGKTVVSARTNSHRFDPRELQSQWSSGGWDWSHKGSMKLVVDVDECWRRLRQYCCMLRHCDEQRPLPRLVVLCGHSSLQVGSVRDVMQLLDGASKKHVHRVLSVSAGLEVVTERQRKQIPNSFEVIVCICGTCTTVTHTNTHSHAIQLALLFQFLSCTLDASLNKTELSKLSKLWGAHATIHLLAEPPGKQPKPITEAKTRSLHATQILVTTVGDSDGAGADLRLTVRLKLPDSHRSCTRHHTSG